MHADPFHELHGSDGKPNPDDLHLPTEAGGTAEDAAKSAEVCKAAAQVAAKFAAGTVLD